MADERPRCFACGGTEGECPNFAMHLVGDREWDAGDKLGSTMSHHAAARMRHKAVPNETEELRRVALGLITAMRRSVDAGCTDHLDDGGDFWHDAIDDAERVLKVKK